METTEKEGEERGAGLGVQWNSRRFGRPQVVFRAVDHRRTVPYTPRYARQASYAHTNSTKSNPTKTFAQCEAHKGHSRSGAPEWGMHSVLRDSYWSIILILTLPWP